MIEADGTLTLRITDLARSGSGVGRDESGRVVFVPLTAPGDLVRVKLTSEEKRYAEAELIELIEASPERVRPRCAVFGRCGGCQWQHLPYELQWRTKLKGVRHALDRVQVQVPEKVEELPAERVWEYRNRIQLRGERGSLGFFARRSNDSVYIDRCEIARPELNARIGALREHAHSLSRPYKVEVEVLADGKVREMWNARTAAMGFRQVHDEQNEKLKAWVVSAITPKRVLLDLFGGSANLSVGLAARMARVECVDVSAPADRPADAPSNVVYHRAAVMPWLVKRSSRGRLEGALSAILDPPREGLAEHFGDIASSLEALGCDELVAVGCDPDSWARDISRFCRRGWRVDRVAVLDLFPQTAHVESLALLTRGRDT